LDAERVRAVGAAVLDVDAVDYLAVVDERTLEPVPRIGPSSRAIVAARLGTTRLIDNLALWDAT
jgi:pantothenate synthetase